MRALSLRFPSSPSPLGRLAAFSLVALSLAARPERARAQSAHPSAERAAIDSVVASLFDAMRKGDSATVRRIFHPRAMLATASAARDGMPQVTMDSVGSFVRAVGAPHRERWDERVYGPVTQVDGHMAVVWAPYSFFLGPTLSHCGTNAFQLAKGADGWRIISLVDTRRRTGCRTDPGA